MRNVKPFRKQPIEDVETELNDQRTNLNRQIRKACFKMLEENREKRKKGIILV